MNTVVSFVVSISVPKEVSVYTVEGSIKMRKALSQLGQSTNDTNPGQDPALPQHNLLSELMKRRKSLGPLGVKFAGKFTTRS